MKPQFTAYKVSPYAGVACTDCHVAPTAAGYLHAKINETVQLFMMVA